MTTQINTHPVSDDVFRAVYDSLASLPDRYRWVTDDGTRQIDQLLDAATKISQTTARANLLRYPARAVVAYELLPSQA